MDEQGRGKAEHRRLPPAEVGAEGRYLGRWTGQTPHSHESGADTDTKTHLLEAGQYDEVIDSHAFDHCLPADVPLTLDFTDQQIGTAHVTRGEDGEHIVAAIIATGDTTLAWQAGGHLASFAYAQDDPHVPWHDEGDPNHRAYEARQRRQVAHHIAQATR